ncbi:MAG: type VI secretion system baseplate subunit TssF [Pseudomonadota bacterium]
MINQFYQQELTYLRELAVEFSQAHPALAPMLSGPSQDPDVERLLEGSAFLTGLVRQKLDDEFPEVVHGLMRLIFPHYLRPLPSTAILVFTPKPGLREPLIIPAGTSLASVPVDGTKCLFSTCYEVEALPLSIAEARLVDQPGRPAEISIRFQLTGLSLENWPSDKLRLHLSGEFSRAADLYDLLLTKVGRVRVSAGEGGATFELNPNRIKPVGLANNESLIPYPSQSFPGYRILQEYFILPEKFLFLDIEGLEALRGRGPGREFTLVFELREKPRLPPVVKKESFNLFATPIINVFPFDAEPISLDHRQPEYRVTPAGGKKEHYQVYAVKSVLGFAPGTVKRREYAPFELFTPQSENSPVYNITRRISASSSLVELFLSVAYPPKSGPPQPETLSISLLCTNSSLPESLKLGDISQPTSTSPELCEFRNISSPTSMVQPPLGKNVLWRFLSHLSLNLLSLADRDNLKALLRLYIFPEGGDRASILANEKRVEGIEGLHLKSATRLFEGLPIRGQKIKLKLNPDNFASLGDMFLFGTIMDHFLGAYASINSYTQLKVEDSLKGESYKWPVRLGDRRLI